MPPTLKNPPFGLRDGAVVHIDEVESGLKCGCVCAACGHPLIARKGKVRRHHFGHHNSAECALALETALHVGAKELILREKRLLLPPVEMKLGETRLPPVVLHEATEIVPDSVTLEKAAGSVVPDVIVQVGETRLFVEIVVTHGISDEKMELLEKLDVSVLEIDLSLLDRDASLDDLRAIVVDSTERKRWVINRPAMKMSAWYSLDPLVLRAYWDKRVHLPYLSGCPVQEFRKYEKGFVDVLNSCLACPFLHRTEPWVAPDHSRAYNPGYVHCLGKRSKQLYSLLRAKGWTPGDEHPVPGWNDFEGRMDQPE